MRLLITTDTVGGVWTYTRELVSGLLPEGVSVLLVTLGRDLSTSQTEWASAMSRDYPARFRIISTSYKLEWMESASADVAASCEQVASLLSEWEPDLLHTNQFCFASLKTCIPKVLVAHSDVISWWQAVHGTAPPRSAWLDSYIEIVSEGVQQASCVIAPTQWMLDQIHANYSPESLISSINPVIPTGVRRGGRSGGTCVESLVSPDAPLSPMHHAFDSGDYSAPLNSQVIANGCSEPTLSPAQPRQLRAVSVGRLWDQGKNIAILRNLNADIPIAVAGELRSPDSGLNPHNAAASGQDGVEYLGVLDKAETNALMQTSAIYVATSRYEPFGFAPVEAALAGCAIVANDIPPLREVWGDAAIYYTRNDPDALRAALSRLIADPALLGHYAQSANRRAHSRYLASKMISAYLHLYRALCPATSFAYA